MKRYSYTWSLDTTDKKWADEGGIWVSERFLVWLHYNHYIVKLKRPRMWIRGFLFYIRSKNLMGICCNGKHNSLQNCWVRVRILGYSQTTKMYEWQSGDCTGLQNQVLWVRILPHMQMWKKPLKKFFKKKYENIWKFKKCPYLCTEFKNKVFEMLGWIMKKLVLNERTKIRC